MRTVKEHDVRRTEILDTAAELFSSQGYAKTTVNDILNRIGIAKGTFYHYFKSKEEVLDAIIERLVAADVAAVRAVVDDPTIPVGEKLARALLAQKPQPDDGGKARLMQQAHQTENAEMHQKTLVQSISRLTPLLAQIVEQGIGEGFFHTPYPQESLELLVAAGQTIFDEGFFHWTGAQSQRRAQAYLHMLEATLGAAPGSLNNMLAILQ